MILFLGDSTNPLMSWLARHKSVQSMTDTLTELPKGTETIVSYGYRHKVPASILKQCRAINLHIGYLPWNRGADPNFWSFIEGTPKGVTIHEMDERIDTGQILAQATITFRERETLSSSYAELHRLIQDLFTQAWWGIIAGHIIPCPQPRYGTYHRSRDKDQLFAKLCTKGWDTPVSVLEEYAEYTAEKQMSQQFWEKYESELGKGKS
ncbi:MAG TPA: formyltransferase family protein [Terriglobia bacterium]|nr:formyltransferase family protein [Terriglobia bacterium]